MSLQATFNQEAINALPLIKEIINKADKIEANQMYCYTLNACCNSRIAIDDMNSKQLVEFQTDLIDIFKFNRWM